MHIFFSFLFFSFAGLYKQLGREGCNHLFSKLSILSCLAFNQIVTNPVAGQNITKKNFNCFFILVLQMESSLQLKKYIVKTFQTKRISFITNKTGSTQSQYGSQTFSGIAVYYCKQCFYRFVGFCKVQLLKFILQGEDRKKPDWLIC